MSNPSYLSICHQNKDGAVKNDMPSAPIPINAGGRKGNGKKKTRRAMPWMRFSRNGNTEVIECDKSTIMKRVSIPARDLRILLRIYTENIFVSDGYVNIPIV
uniref:Uncharacterized protein n=1 Tax=Brassica campestris TaxID=3711 RepID=M4EV49_BRACM